MCSDRPLHNDLDTIKSKLWIIGRAYSAAIERKAGKGFRIEDAAALIMSSEIDVHITKLRSIERINKENTSTLLSSHKYVTDILKSATGLEKRSLASKYLHFHAPKAVFIYDSIANTKIKEILAPAKQSFKSEGNYDQRYEAFVLRCIYFRDYIFEKSIGCSATPRKIDMHLLNYS
jgi:hypothetical protein